MAWSSASRASSILAPLLGSLPCLLAAHEHHHQLLLFSKTATEGRERESTPRSVGASPSFGRSGLSSLPAFRLLVVLSEAAPSLFAIDLSSLESWAWCDPG